MNAPGREVESRAAEEPIERHEVVVVGAGQAGLAIGRELAAADRRFVILEGAAEVGAAWRARWDSLVLFTPRRYSGLPALPTRGSGFPSSATTDACVTFAASRRPRASSSSGSRGSTRAARR